MSLSPPPADGGKQIVLGPELDYFLHVSELGTSGGLAVIVREFTDGEDTTVVPEDSIPLVEFAAWPAVADCPSWELVAPLDRSIDGMSPLHISELVAAQAVPFTWADGTETTLVLSPRPRAAVVSPPPACDLEECDVRYTLAEGRVPETAAPPE